MKFKEICESIQLIEEKRREIVNKCAEEKRVWNADEMTAYAAMETEQQELRKQAKIAEAFETAVMSQDVESVTRGRSAEQEDRTARKPVAKQHDPEQVNQAFRDWMCGANPKYRSTISAERRNAAEKLGWSVDSEMISLTLPQHRSSSPEYRAPQTVTTSGGGYVIPDEMMRGIDVAMRDYGGLYNYATVIRTATGADLPIPTINDTSTGAGFGAKLDINTATTDQIMTFGQVVLQAYKYTSKIVLVPMELMQDAYFNIGEFTGRMLGERIARFVSQEFITGDGTGDINGLATASTAATNVTTTTSNLAADNAPTYANLLAIQHSVDPAYRRSPSCAWVMSDTVFKAVKAIVDGQSRPLWLPNIIAGAPETLLGHPIVVDNGVDTAGTTGAKVLLFGDLSKYHIREVSGIEVLRLVERYAEYAQTGFVAFARFDGDLINAGTNPVVHATNP